MIPEMMDTINAASSKTMVSASLKGSRRFEGRNSKICRVGNVVELKRHCLDYMSGPVAHIHRLKILQSCCQAQQAS